MNGTDTPDPQRIAILLMDLQQLILANYGPDDTRYIERLRTLRDAAAGCGALVVHVVTNFRPGHPEVSDSNATFAGIRDAGLLELGDDTSAIHPRMTPGNCDVVVGKRRISAFAGSDLEMLLRAKGIETLVLAGVSTSGVVLSTLRAAADLDYRLVVLSDGCHDPDPEVHRVLMSSVFPTQAEVTTVDAWLRELDDASAAR